MASNRFAQLSPDFDAEELERQKKAKELKAKKEAAVAKEEKTVEKPHKQEEVVSHEETGRGRGQGQRRSRGRGYGEWRGTRGGEYHPRGRGGYHRGGNFEEESRPGEKPEGREAKPYRFRGDPNARHPYDRRSGTGYGTEVPKGGRGRGNWGHPAEDWKHEPKLAETEQKEEDKGVVAEPVKEEGKHEEKKVEEKKPPEPVYTYSEYKAMMAENMKGLATKKAEEKIAKDPKAAGLKVHEKEQYSNISTAASKKKKKEKEEEEEEAKKVALGGFILAPIELPPRPPRDAEGKYEYPRPRKEGRRERPVYKEPVQKKPEAAPFVLKEDDFPKL